MMTWVYSVSSRELELHRQQLRRAADAAQRVLDLVRQVAHQFLVGLRLHLRAFLAVVARLLLDLDQLDQHALALVVHLADDHVHRPLVAGHGPWAAQAAQGRAHHGVETPAGDLVVGHQAQRLAQRRGVGQPVEHAAAHQRAARHAHHVLEGGIHAQAVALGADHGHHRGQVVEGLEAVAVRGAHGAGSLAISRLRAEMSASLRVMAAFISATRSR
jgi:hypothetical protein